MILTSFSNTQVILLSTAGTTFLLSLFFQVKQKEYLAVGFLIITALLVFSFAAMLDPFINLWDERFHALVAKNMMNHPLMPTLYDDPVVNMAYDRWDRYFIWLHKQPLFLWQIALSYKIFGISEFSLRIPDIILGAVMVFAMYRSGKLLVNPRVGYLAGVLALSTMYFLELVAGRQEVDHNDFTFMVYVSLSLWSLIEYRKTNRTFWIYLVGAFSGLAILCKWAVGLLVYLGWVIVNLYQKKYRVRDYSEMAIALSITFLIALPWQILTFFWYPTEAHQAFLLNSSHLWVPVDGQRGIFWYHIERFHDIYGAFAPFLIVPAFYLLLKNNRDKAFVISCIWMVIGVYLFFSLAETKMASFTIVVSMIIIIAFAALMDSCWSWINAYLDNAFLGKMVFAVMVIGVLALRFDVGSLKEKHSVSDPKNVYSQMLMHNKEVFLSLNLPENAVLFNVKGRHYIEAMFYTGLPSYNFVPTLLQYKDLKAKGRRVAIIRPKNQALPDYLVNDSTTIIIDKEIRGYN
jgi:4-amino-4-deoxy-L-arabinose transferase-like glycosyltransferase